MQHAYSYTARRHWRQVQCLDAVVVFCGFQVVVGALQQAVEAQTPTSPNPLPRAMQLVTNISSLMHALPHLDEFTVLAARS